MLTLGTLFAIVQSMTLGANGSVSRWWLLHILPVGHYWFLEALFIIFLIVLALEQLHALTGRLVFFDRLGDQRADACAGQGTPLFRFGWCRLSAAFFSGWLGL